MNLSKISRRYTRLTRIISNTRDYLDRVLPGAMTRINWHFYRSYNTSFIEFFLEEPIKAYRSLLDLYGAERKEERDNINYIIYLVLKGIFIGRSNYINIAYNAVISGDKETFEELLDNYLETIT